MGQGEDLRPSARLLPYFLRLDASKAREVRFAPPAGFL